MAMNPLGNMGTGGRRPQPLSVAEGEWKPASVETCRIINVNIEQWSVDCVSEHGNKRFFDIQVMAPYFHFLNGEGIYAQPEVGALCWVCVPSSGRFAAPFVMGFQSAHDDDFDSFQGGRQALNPGDIMMRTRDENFLILRRGGVVQIGATPTAQRFYLPIRNFIKDFCENYELFTFGGELTWLTQRDDQTTDGKALTTLTFKVKEHADNKLQIATLSIGSHGDSDKTTLKLEINDSGDDGNKVMVSLAITKEGDVGWTLEKGFAIEAKENVQITSLEKDITVKAAKGQVLVQANKAATMKSDTDAATVEGQTMAVLKSGTKAMLDAPMMHLGNGAASPLVKGDMLVSLLGTLITQISTFACGPPGSPVVAAPAIASLSGQLSGLLSTASFTK